MQGIDRARIPGILGWLLAALSVLPAHAADVLVKDRDALAAAIKAARPGDTISLADGTWRDAAIQFAAKGTEGHPITLRADHPGKVELSGSSRLSIAGQYLVVDGLFFTDGAISSESVIEFRGEADETSSHCRLTNCAIVDYRAPSIKTDTKWVSVYGKANRVDHCYFA